MNTNTINLEKRVVVRQDWLESESGWGTRPDGCSLHKTIEDCGQYIDEYWKKMPDEVPDEYERPSEEPYEMAVPGEVYASLAASRCGIRIYQFMMDCLKDGSDPTDEYTHDPTDE